MKYKMNKAVIAVDIIMIAVLIFLDQLSKSVVNTYLKSIDSIVLIPGVFELRYLENRGAAFGILQNKQWFFLLISIAFFILAIVLLVWIPTYKKYRLLRFTLVLLAGGAFGNLIDRACLGYVIDFLYFVYINFPIFNVADCYVSVGTALLVILVMFYYKDEELDFKKARADIKIHSSLRNNENDSEKPGEAEEK